MYVDLVAAYLLANRGRMPLTGNIDHLRRYIGLNIEDNTIRLVQGGDSRLKGVCLWKMTTEQRGEPGVWEKSSEDGNIIVVYHLVATDRRAVSRIAGYLLERYPNAREVWGERSGKPKKYSIDYLRRLRDGKRR